MRLESFNEKCTSVREKHVMCLYCCASKSHDHWLQMGEQEKHNGLTGHNYRMHLNASRSSSCVSNPGCTPLQKNHHPSSPVPTLDAAHRPTVHTRSVFRTRHRRHLCHILAHWVDSQLHAGVALHCCIKNSNVGHIEWVTLKNEWACGETHQVPKLIV